MDVKHSKFYGSAKSENDSLSYLSSLKKHDSPFDPYTYSETQDNDLDYELNKFFDNLIQTINSKFGEPKIIKEFLNKVNNYYSISKEDEENYILIEDLKEQIKVQKLENDDLSRKFNEFTGNSFLKNIFKYKYFSL